jgi:putative hydrolase of the HAD superfamily
MRRYDHLFFDLDNTLWDFNTNSRLAMELTLKQTTIIDHLTSFDEFFEVYAKINKSLWADYHSKKITKQVLIVERFSKSLHYFGISNQNYQELNKQYLNNMALQTGLFSDAIDTLDILKLKGYQMHIITNGFREVQRKKLTNCNLDQFFTKVFISEEIQTTKPHREIFEHALKSGNALKKKSIMIGDSWDADIMGAMNFGMDQIMFLNQGQNEIPESISLLKQESKSSFLVSKHQTRTYFANKLTDLVTIL